MGKLMCIEEDDDGSMDGSMGVSGNVSSDGDYGAGDLADFDEDEDDEELLKIVDEEGLRDILLDGWDKDE